MYALIDNKVQCIFLKECPFPLPNRKRYDKKINSAYASGTALISVGKMQWFGLCYVAGD